MPWKNIPPELLDMVINFLGMLLAGLIGATSRIADEVKAGDRDRFWGKELIVDITSFSIMILCAAALAEYLELSILGASALAGVFCRAGTPLLDTALNTAIERITGNRLKK